MKAIQLVVSGFEARTKGEYDQAEEQRFLYRHWIQLDPPDEELAKALAEEKRVSQVKQEYDERCKQISGRVGVEKGGSRAD